MDNKTQFNTIKVFTDSLNGGAFIAIDTLTDVTLKGGKSNPMQGRVQKRVTGSSVQIFQNKQINAYEAKVKRRLEAAGTDPKNFELSDRRWGMRMKDIPFVEHKGKYYLEVIFLKAGMVEYLLDGEVVYKDEIIGLPDTQSPAQGGLEDKVILRDYNCNSITGMRINKVKLEFVA